MSLVILPWRERRASSIPAQAGACLKAISRDDQQELAKRKEDQQSSKSRMTLKHELIIGHLGQTDTQQYPGPRIKPAPPFAGSVPFIACPPGETGAGISSLLLLYTGILRYLPALLLLLFFSVPAEFSGPHRAARKSSLNP